MLKYRFQNLELMDLALTHSSLGTENYERLEFLGDAVLGYGIADIAYHNYPSFDEGQLTRVKSARVSNQVFAALARHIGLTEHIQYDTNVIKEGIKDSDAVHADVLEALIGAVSIDGGIAEALKIVKRFNRLIDRNKLGLDREDVVGELVSPSKHPKNRLQEYCVKLGKSIPRYEVVFRPQTPQDGPFKVRCQIQVAPHRTTAEGKTIKEAESNAAVYLLAQIGVDA